jgi:hypothetical protein
VGETSRRALISPTRYWAGRHHVSIVTAVALALVSAIGDRPFTASQIDSVLRERLVKDLASPISKGKRWAYLKVQRDVGLVACENRNTYRLTDFARCLAKNHERESECLSRALIRPFEEDNPVHSVLSLFIETWPSTIEEFITNGQMVRFRSESDTSMSVTGPKQALIHGIGKNEFNQVWNGVLPFLEQITLLGRFDPQEDISTERVYAPVWDWSLEPSSFKSILNDLQSHVKETYPVGKMIGLPDLVRDFWKARKVSPKITLEILYEWAGQSGSEIYLVRAPLAVAEQMKYSYIVKATATYGAFVRREV